MYVKFVYLVFLVTQGNFYRQFEGQPTVVHATRPLQHHDFQEKHVSIQMSMDSSFGDCVEVVTSQLPRVTMALALMCVKHCILSSFPKNPVIIIPQAHYASGIRTHNLCHSRDDATGLREKLSM